MHAATMNSPRLRKVAKLLANGKPHSTLDIFNACGVLAVSATIAELRQNGARIECVRRMGDNGGFYWVYTMLEGPKDG